MMPESNLNDRRTEHKYTSVTVSDALQAVLNNVLEHADDETAQNHAKLGLELLEQVEGEQ